MEDKSVVAKPSPQPEPEGMTFKSLRSKIVTNWYWFVAFAVVGISLAFLYKKFSPSYYRIAIMILIKSDNKSTDLNSVFRELKVNSSNPTIQDQVGVLKSYNLNLRTIQSFNWRYSWYKKGTFTNSDLYGNDPFMIEIPDESSQLENVPLIIKVESDNEYTIKCDKTVKLKNGEKVEIDFNKRVKFGQIFQIDHFNFLLKKRKENPVNVGDEFVLEFNNLGHLALSYKEKLIVKPEDTNGQSNLIRVELTTHNLSRDVDYLNQLGKIYIQFGLDEKNRIANNTIKFIDDQISGVDRSLQIAGDQFTSFRAQNRTVDLGQEATTVVDKLKQIEGERADLDLQLEYFNNLKYYLENRDQNKDLVAPSLVGVTDVALNQKVIRLNELYVKREVLSYTAQERNPALISLTNEITYTQKSLKENVENLIANTKVEIQSLIERQKTVNSELSRLPKTEQNLIGIKRNFDLNNELYTFLLQRRAEAEISKASNNPDAQILDPTDNGIAVLLGPMLLINLLVGLFGGIFAALGVVIVKEVFFEVLTDIDDITRRLDVAVIGSVSYNKHQNEIPVVIFPRSALTESFRGLRLNLEYFFKNVNGNVLAIHSYISGEGKSFVAVNLASIFALGHKRVLLVDCDLRKPRLHEILDQKPEIGLSEFLEGKNTFDEIIRPTDVELLSFVASGTQHFNSAELLNNGVIKDFIAKAKEKFDYVILDNSPIGVVYDPVIVGMNADFNLVLLRLNYSKGEHIDAINKIGHEGILKRVMVAVNGKKQVRSYGYYTEESKADRLKKEIEIEPVSYTQAEQL